MRTRFDSLLKHVESNDIASMSDNEISTLTGGADIGSGGGSQTSGTGSESANCCDGTCVCKCLPIPPAKDVSL